MKDITEVEYRNIINDGKDKIIIFSAPWCGPCRMFKPQLDSFTKENSIDFYAINIDEEQYLAEELNIRSVPMTILYKDDVVDNIVGARLDKVKEFYGK